MKSFSDNPPMECVESSTSTLPHEIERSGWCPSASAILAIFVAKSNASLKSLNLNDFDIACAPGQSIQSFSSFKSFSASCTGKGGPPFSQGIQCLADNSAFIFARPHTNGGIVFLLPTERQSMKSYFETNADIDNFFEENTMQQCLHWCGGTEHTSVAPDPPR